MKEPKMPSVGAGNALRTHEQPEHPQSHQRGNTWGTCLESGVEIQQMHRQWSGGKARFASRKVIVLPFRSHRCAGCHSNLFRFNANVERQFTKQLRRARVQSCCATTLRLLLSRAVTVGHLTLGANEIGPQKTSRAIKWPQGCDPGSSRVRESYGTHCNVRHGAGFRRRRPPHASADREGPSYSSLPRQPFRRSRRDWRRASRRCRGTLRLPSWHKGRLRAQDEVGGASAPAGL
jgi:hypothetical protein